MKTTKISTSMAAPGMTVAEDVYSFSDQLIINAGIKLDDRIITRLKFYSVPELWITVPEAGDEDDEFAGEPLERVTPPPPEPYSLRVRHSAQFKRFSRTFSSSLLSSRSKLNSVLTDNKDIDTASLLDDVTAVLASCSNPTSLFDMLMCIRDLDDVTFVHSFSVSLICTVLGKWLKFPADIVNRLSLCGLLHDVGKLQIPQALLTKREPLSHQEYIELQSHAMYGYQMLKDLPVDENVKLSALMHHERCDGSGYPSGLTGDQIDPFAKIVAIADVYEAMTSARVYRGPICPLEVIGIFESEGLHKYEPKYLLTFLHGIIETYLNHTVTLNDGTEGEIIMINRTAISRPLLHLKDGGYLDLSRHPELSIVGMI